MATKKYDVAAKTGEYTDNEGNTKSRWQNVGAVLENENGPFLILEPWFNPAGLKSSVLSLFTPKSKQGGQSAPPQDNSGIEDEVPF